VDLNAILISALLQVATSTPAPEPTVTLATRLVIFGAAMFGLVILAASFYIFRRTARRPRR
jgi:Co/Zn/Cd efflux system component